MKAWRVYTAAPPVRTYASRWQAWLYELAARRWGMRTSLYVSTDGREWTQVRTRR